VKTYLDCYPCFLRQALEAARMAGADEGQQQQAIDRVLDLLRQGDASRTPPEIGDRVHRVVRQVVEAADPYRKVKARSTREALAMVPRLKTLLSEADDPLEVAVRLSIAGNIIMLQLKCPVIARDVGAPVGSIVLKRGRTGHHLKGKNDYGSKRHHPTVDHTLYRGG